MAALRRAVLEEVSEDDLRAIVRQIVAQARGGDLSAAREVFLRTLGRPVELDLGPEPEEDSLQEVMIQEMQRMLVVKGATSPSSRP